MPPPTMPDLTSARVRTALWVIGSLAVVALTIGALVLVAGIYELVDATRATQVANTGRAEKDRVRDEQTAAAARDAARTVDRIEDCTTPGRPCFQENARRTSDAVAGINQGTLAVIVAALSCQADDIIEQRALARCTAQRAQASSVKATQPQESR